MSKTIKKPASTTKTGAIYGLRDIVTQTSPAWHTIIKTLQNTGRIFGFMPIFTSIIEEEKIYNDAFKDHPRMINRTVLAQLGSKVVALRSSLLPSIIRHYVNQKVAEAEPLSKWSFIGNVVEQDERQAVHLKYQYGFEVFGTFNHLSEAQVICAAWDFFTSLGLESLQLEINMVGDNAIQNNYQANLKEFLKTRDFDLCENCINDSANRALDVFRCQNLNCQLVVAEAPSMLDYLDQPTKAHFTNVLEALDELSIPYQLNQYYVGPYGSSKVNFVIKYNSDKKTIILGEGSHHEQLFKNIHGKLTPAFGFIGDLALIYEALEEAGIEKEKECLSEVFLVPLGELAAKRSLRLFRDLVASQIAVHDHFGTEGVKNQLKVAQESKAPIALIMGQKEAMDDMVILRDVKSGMQEIFSYDKIIDEVRKRLGR